MDNAYRSFSEIELDQPDEGVLLVTLNRPDQLNAWNEALLSDLAALWPLVQSDDAVRVVIISGAGRAFSVGGDLEMVAAFTEDIEKSVESSVRYTQVLRALMDLQKPVVAAVNGDVLGGGMGLVLLCDVIFMSSSARMLCGSQLNINVMPAPEALLWRIRGVPDAKAKFHLLRSDTISATTAESIGLVSAVVDDDKLMDESVTYASELASRDPMMMGWTKRALNFELRSAAPLLDEWLAMEALSFARASVKPALQRIRSGSSIEEE